MARLQVIVDGEQRFDGQVPDSYLPSRPDAFPRALGAAGTLRPGEQPPPLARLFQLTIAVGILERLCEGPMIGVTPVIRPRGPGQLTIAIDLPGMPSTIDEMKP